MSKSFKLGTVTKEDQRNYDRKVRREYDIENKLNNNHNRIHKSKKQYNRKNFSNCLEY